MKRTIDDLLNEVNYDEINSYIPSKFALEFIATIKSIAGSTLENATPPIHYKMIDGLTTKDTHLVNLCHRGVAKTTLFCEFLIMYLAIFGELPSLGKVTGIIFVGDSMENGVKSLRKNLEFRYNNSEVMRSLVPKASFTDSYIEFENRDGYILGIRLFGSKTSLRGVRINGNRPNLAILDDLLSDDDAKSPPALERIKDTIYKAVDYALVPNQPGKVSKKVILNGTPFNKADPIIEAAESGEWVVNVYPVCEEFPVEKKNFRGSWEERFSYDFVKKQYDMAVATGNVASFNQELMLRIASEDERLISSDDIMWVNRADILAKQHQYNFVITTDFGFTNKKGSDPTVIYVWALDWQNNIILVDGKIGRQLIDETFNDIFRFVKKYEPLTVGMEISGGQIALVSLMQKEMINRGLYFTIASPKGNRNVVGIPVNTNKFQRINLAVPFFKNKQIFFPREDADKQYITELLDQLSLVTHTGIKSKHDDCIDAVSQLTQFNLIFPDERQGKSELKDISNPYHYDEDEEEYFDYASVSTSVGDYLI